MNIEEMILFYLYYNHSCIYYLLLHIYILYDIFSLLIPSSTIYSILKFLSNSNFTSVFFKTRLPC